MLPPRGAWVTEASVTMSLRVELANKNRRYIMLPHCKESGKCNDAPKISRSSNWSYIEFKNVRLN